MFGLNKGLASNTDLVQRWAIRRQSDCKWIVIQLVESLKRVNGMSTVNEVSARYTQVLSFGDLEGF